MSGHHHQQQQHHHLHHHHNQQQQQQQQLLQNQPINLTKINDSHRILINDGTTTACGSDTSGRYTGALISDDASTLHPAPSSAPNPIGIVSSSPSSSSYASASSSMHPSGIRRSAIASSQATAVRLSTVPQSHPLHTHQQQHTQPGAALAPARMLLPVSPHTAAAASTAHVPLIRSTAAAAVPLAQSGAVVRALARCGRLAPGPSAGGATVVAAARAPAPQHVGLVRAGASHARLCSISPSATVGGAVPPRFSAVSAARPLHVTTVPVARSGGGVGNYRSLMTIQTTTTPSSVSASAVSGGGVMLSSRATITAVCAAPAAAMAVSVTTVGGALIAQQQQQLGVDQSGVIPGSLASKSGSGGSTRPWHTVANSGVAPATASAASSSHSVSSSATILPVAKVVPHHTPAMVVDASLRDLSVAGNKNTGYSGSTPAMVLARPAIAFTYPPSSHLSAVVTTTAAGAPPPPTATTLLSTLSGNSGVVLPADSQQQQQMQQRIPTTTITDSFNTELAVGATQRLSLMLENRLGGGSNSQHQHQQQQAAVARITTSPRPSILRKRDSELCGSRSSRDLSRQLLDATATSASPITPSPTLQLLAQQQQQQNTRQRCLSSGHSSSTVSASSSPGQTSPPEEAPLPPPPTSASDDPHQQQQQLLLPGSVTPSPRRKPRKQNFGSTSSASMVLTFPSTSALVEPHTTLSTTLAPSGGAETKHDWPTGLTQYTETAAGQGVASHTVTRTVFRRPVMSMLQSSGIAGGKDAGSGGWRANSSHFERYQDVRVKDDRRPNIVDLASQRRLTQKVNGWKIHQLNGHTAQLQHAEKLIHRQLTELLRGCEKLKLSRREDKELAKLVELIKSNLQRSKITSDQLTEASSQLSAVLHHKPTVLNVIERYARKRSARKRERH